MGHQAHLDQFKKDKVHQNRLYQRVLSFWAKHDSDADGLIQEEELPAFMGDFWGDNKGDWGKKFWRAVNARDVSY